MYVITMVLATSAIKIIDFFNNSELIIDIYLRFLDFLFSFFPISLHSLLAIHRLSVRSLSRKFSYRQCYAKWHIGAL